MTIELEILNTYRLPRPIGPVVAKSFKTYDWLAVRVLPKLFHIFINGSLRQIWRFPAEPVEISLEHSVQNDDFISVLVATADGAVFRMRSTHGRYIDKR